MTFITEFARSHQALVSGLRLCLIFLACAALATLLLAAVQRVDAALSPPPSNAPSLLSVPSAPVVSTLPDRPQARGTALAPTFAAAAESLRTGRYAEAYGRFVRLADEGHADAGRIALVMHRFGPSVFASAWDARVEQLVEWMRWSETATGVELAQLRAAPHGFGTDTVADGQVPPRGAITCSR
jgi:hypothetical protein